MNIEDYEFSDKDIVGAYQFDKDVMLVFKRSTSVNHLCVNQEDIIALAKSANVTAEDLTNE